MRKNQQNHTSSPRPRSFLWDVCEGATDGAIYGVGISILIAIALAVLIGAHP